MQHIAGDMAKFGDCYWSIAIAIAIAIAIVLKLFYTASQCAFISGLLGKLSVSVVDINFLSFILCPLKVIDVMYQATLHKEVTRYKVMHTFQ